MGHRFIRNGFFLSGFINIFAVLLLSRGFTNTVLNQADPVVMSNFGLLMIMIWGLVFIATARTDARSQRLLASAFVVEKLVYVISWVYWQLNNDVFALYGKDVFAGIFYSVYGLNDLAFMIFYFLVAAGAGRHSSRETLNVP